MRWKYKGLNKNSQIVYGIGKAENFFELVIKLRNDHLIQVINATSISEVEYSALRKIYSSKAEPQFEMKHNKTIREKLASVLSKCFAIFR